MHPSVSFIPFDDVIGISERTGRPEVKNYLIRFLKYIRIDDDI